MIFPDWNGRLARDARRWNRWAAPLACMLPIMLMLLLLGSVLESSIAKGEEAGLARFAYERAEMGLPFRAVLYAKDEASARKAADAAFDRVAQLNSVFSDYDPDSEVSRLSRTSGEGRFVPVTTDLWNILSLAHKLSAQTDGAFDVTIGPLVNVWRRARRKRELPSEALVTEFRARVGWQKMELDPEARAVRLNVPEMRIDLGAIAKGYAIDQAVRVLRERGISRVLVSGSGDMLAGDPPPGKDGWKIELPPIEGAPNSESEVATLNNRALATSGDTFQFVEIDGVRYSHIVDPRTGVGLTDHSLVSILAPDCLTADSLSTSVSVLGPKRGLELVEAHPGAAARVMRMPRGGSLEVYRSSRWAELLPGSGAKR